MKTYSHSSERGAVLVGFMMILVLVLSLVGISILELAGSNAADASTALGDGQAFWLAEAGLHDAMALGHINFHRDGESVPFPEMETRTWTRSSSKGEYTVDITGSGNSFVITSTGTSKSGISRTVKANYTSGPAISAGAYGNLSLYFKPGLTVYSYDSTLVQNPTPADSTFEAIFSANGNITVQTSAGTRMDGIIYFGTGTDGVFARDNSSFSGPNSEEVLEGSIDVGRIDPDPLDLFGDSSNPNALAYDYENAKSSNNNSTIVIDKGSLDGTDRLTLDKNGSVTLTAGTYHFNGWMLENNTTVNVDASGGRVNIFMSDLLAFKNSGVKWEYNLLGGGAGDVSFFFRVDGGTVNFNPDSSLSCFIYAPRMEITASPNFDFYGSVWAERVQFWPGASAFIDTSIMNDDTIGGNKTYHAGGWSQSTRF